MEHYRNHLTTDPPPADNPIWKRLQELAADLRFGTFECLICVRDGKIQYVETYNERRRVAAS